MTRAEYEEETMDHDHQEDHKFIIPDVRKDRSWLQVNPAEEDDSLPEVVMLAPQVHRSASQNYLRNPEDTLPQALLVSPVSPSGDDGLQTLRVWEPERRASRMESLKMEDQWPRETSSSRKRILGLSVVWFWVVISLLIVILAIGLGVGIAVGVGNSRTAAQPTSTSTGVPTPTSGQGVASPAAINPYCPSQNGTAIMPYDASGTSIQLNENTAQEFTMLCNTYWPAKRVNPGVRDIMIMAVPDMLTCLALCAEYNSGYSDAIGDDAFRNGGGMCVGVSLIRGPAEFCYLKNATGINDTTAAGGSPVDSAVLVGKWASLSRANQTAIFAGDAVAG